MSAPIPRDDPPHRIDHPLQTPVKPDPLDATPKNPPGLVGGLPAHPLAPSPESRWVPLIPGGQSIPSGLSARSGAFLMTATRPEPGPRPVAHPTPPELEIRSALISCLEALVPTLEPGWSHCREHPGCRAVQEASGVLWGAESRVGEKVAAAPVPTPESKDLAGSDPNDTNLPSGNPPAKSPVTPSPSSP